MSLPSLPERPCARFRRATGALAALRRRPLDLRAKTPIDQIIKQPHGQHFRVPAGRFCLRRPGMDIDMRPGLRPFDEAAQKQSPPEILLRSAKELEQVLVEKPYQLFRQLL
jgi:hypothetical protein